MRAGIEQTRISLGNRLQRIAAQPHTTGLAIGGRNALHHHQPRRVRRGAQLAQGKPPELRRRSQCHCDAGRREGNRLGRRDLRQSEKLQGPDAVQGFSDRAGSQELAYLHHFPVGRAAETPELQIDDTQFTWILKFIRHCRAEGKIHASFACEGFLGNYEGEVRDQIFHCNAGISTASVLIDGSISGCPSIRANFHQGNIYKDSFVDVWNNGFKEYRNREWARKGQCADCDMFRYCEGSGMHLHDDSGDLITCHYRRIEN